MIALAGVIHAASLIAGTGSLAKAMVGDYSSADVGADTP